MAVLVEGISVIVLRSRLESLYPGGYAGFVADCPNGTLCADSRIARVGFMTPADVQRWVDRLVATGLEFVRDGVAVDIAVVDQVGGTTVRCPWLEVGTVTLAGGAVRACRLAGDAALKVSTPDGWTYAGSLSATHDFVPNDQIADTVQFLRHEHGVDVFLNRLAGKVVYVGRTSRTPILPTAPRGAKDRN